MKIATWNINGVQRPARQLSIHWLNESAPDIVCLQEIKSVDEEFPRAEIEALGYNVATHGQKGFNGVAILSKLPFDEVTSRPAGRRRRRAGALHRRRVLDAGQGRCASASLYLPNGNPIGTDKFPYKLAWMERLEHWAASCWRWRSRWFWPATTTSSPSRSMPRYPEAWVNDALFQPETRQAFRRLVNLGFTDAVRACHRRAAGIYTFWDYQAGAWQKDNGIRIDHLLLSPQAADRLASASIEKHVRGWEKPSDHVPVGVELAL